MLAIFTGRTTDELESLLDSADREYAAHPPFDLQTASNFADALDNPFLRAWLASWSEQKSMPARSPPDGNLLDENRVQMGYLKLPHG